MDQGNNSEIIRASLEITQDPYRGFHITIIKPVQEKEFLQFANEFCQKELLLNQSKDLSTQTTVLWIHLAPPNLNLLAQLCQSGFQIHRGKNKSVSVYKWLSKKKCLIPPYSVFFIACGAVLIKDECIFLVQQKSGDRKGCFNLPGGRADPNQTIPDCAERELFEETNIKAKFKYILTFRESTPSLYDSVDLYFPCYMELSEDSLKDLKLCQRQISSCKWVPLKDYQQFMVENSNTYTQKTLAQYITRLWKSGFDFEKMIPNVTKTELIQKKTGDQKFVMHELITKF